ncbi:serine/threonine-protein kinase [Streptomyces sp. ST2-7A]|uniref:serine/threonine-protein kinase n=1 Tax=Streptomyces sp. ST2-7A TaxID=2907214 RepID=UPI002278878E|nr:serine/threonine-protein kinase [Streptomyces sp. ST2-7A]
MTDPGLIHGRYELLEQIGRGGMGQVWRARDRALDRRVAVKCFRPGGGPGDDSVAPHPLRERFRREARLAAGLQHHGITVVHDFGEHEGLLYLVMEFLDGRNLGVLLADRAGAPLPHGEVADIARQVAEALDHTRGRGIVHRDLKPANIIRLTDGTVKVCDFGIARPARDIDPDARLTVTGMAMGTPHYMSPEQISGGVVDPRSDLYSLGCVLYELATGRPPFAYDDPWAVLIGHRDAAPEPPHRLRPDLPLGLERLILDLLAKVPDHRPLDTVDRAARLVGRAAPSRSSGRRLIRQPTAGSPGAGDTASATGDSRRHPGVHPGAGTHPRDAGHPDPAGRPDRYPGPVPGTPGFGAPAHTTRPESIGRGGPGVPAAGGPSTHAPLPRRPLSSPPGRTGGFPGRGSVGAVMPGAPPPPVPSLPAAGGPGVPPVAEWYPTGPPTPVPAHRPTGPPPAHPVSRYPGDASFGRLPIGDRGWDSRWEEARTVHAALADDRARTLGEEHPETLDSLHHVAFALGRLGRWEEALHGHRGVAAARGRTLGPRHPDTLASRYECAICLGRLGRPAEALEVYRNLVADRSVALGGDHPATLRARHGLGVTLGRLGRWEEALCEARNVCAMRSALLGTDHPDTLVSRREVAVALGRMGRWGPALEEYRRVRLGRERSLGPDHPDTLAAREDEARCRELAGPDLPGTA